MNAGNAGSDVVVNRTASQLRTNGGLARIIAAAAAAGGARLHETNDLEDLEHVARDIAARGSDTVVLAGGDGSYMAGLSALSRAYGPRALPRVALAPGGTVCTVARNLGMRGRARPWAERVIRAACDATTRTASHPTLRVRDDGGGDRVGFIFGAGLVARFFDAYYEAPRPGRAAAASLVARIFVGSFAGGRLAETVLRPTRAVLKIDGAVHPARDWNLVLASVVRDVGLHMLVPYRAGEENERFHLVASGLAARALARQLPRVLAGKPLGGEPRVDTLARALRVAFEGTGGSYVLDGDKF
ncbi:MAG TPA: diacylglycerol kinase family protein, partial [Polyangiaceae bacterium]